MAARRRGLPFVLPLAVVVASSTLAANANLGGDWPVYGGNAAGQRFSQLRQIAPANVSKLQQVWRFETGPGGLQVSPIMADGVLYLCGPDQSVMALDPASGRQIWKFTPPTPGMQPVRGLTLWREGGERRLFISSSYFLYGLDPNTGQPLPSFGDHGRIDLREGLGRDPQSLAVFLTSPGIVWHDMIITGFRTGEGSPSAPGAVRAYDVRTGKLRWLFKALPDANEPGSETWPGNAWATGGGGNNWAGMALDEKRGIVFVPTGSAVSDFYGADRKGNNLYANSLLALDASTGKLLWHFQAVHHDLWDRDLGSPPSLLTVRQAGRKIDAVAQPGKNGFLFVFDRVTGRPLFPIEERAVPQSTVPGEHSSTTQPFPTGVAPLARQQMSESDLTVRTPEAHAAALDAFRKLRSEGLYTPLEAGRKSVAFPGTDGGAEWGGAAVDPGRGLLFINVNDVPWLGGLRRNESNPAASPGKAIYDQHCAVCHGAERKGSPPDFPGLIDVGRRLSRAEVTSLVANGKGRMPGFPQLVGTERDSILGYLLAGSATESGIGMTGLNAVLVAEYGKMAGNRQEAYLYTGYEKFRDPDGYPAAKPPWGTLNAIDLNSGRSLWKVPLGEYPELMAKGMGITGTENYGGPLLTASGLLFIGATIYDRKFRAFEARSGRLLWEGQLPYAGTASPITYMAGGRQFVVIATSGSRDPKGPQGSAYVAFALPPR